MKDTEILKELKDISDSMISADNFINQAKYRLAVLFDNIRDLPEDDL